MPNTENNELIHACATGLVNGMNESYETIIAIKDAELERERRHSEFLEQKLRKIYVAFGLIDDA